MDHSSRDIALLLHSSDGVEIELARSLLIAAGIPTLLDDNDFDVSEMWSASQINLRAGHDLYVPAAALARARSVLEQAWGERNWE